LGSFPFRHNGTVTANLTAFVAEGTQRETKDFLRDVGRWLSTPHLERLEIESRVLESEAAMSSGGPLVPAMRLRFGPSGYGLVGYDQYGLRRLGEEEVAAWIRDRFTSENAAIWLTGPLDDVDVALPGGRRVPPPPLNPLVIAWPVHSAIGDQSAALHFLLHRTPAHTVALAILGRRAERRLRYERGVSYSVTGLYEALTADEAHALLMADSRPGTAPSVTEDLLAVLDDLGREGPTEEEVRGEVGRHADPDKSDSVAALAAAARDVLLDTPVLWTNELADAFASVTPEAVCAAARGLWERMLVLGAPSPRRGIEAYPDGTGDVIEGETFPGGRGDAAGPAPHRRKGGSLPRRTRRSEGDGSIRLVRRGGVVDPCESHPVGRGRNGDQRNERGLAGGRACASRDRRRAATRRVPGSASPCAAARGTTLRASASAVEGEVRRFLVPVLTACPETGFGSAGSQGASASASRVEQRFVEGGNPSLLPGASGEQATSAQAHEEDARDE
jgi:hypothetical protein